MVNFIDVKYQHTGKSLETDQYGMREMQRRAFAQRNAQYLLLKAPPASGKSRALMFLSLDKLYNQGIKKVIVAVPEKVIGGSFGRVKLTEHGFFANWSGKHGGEGFEYHLLVLGICIPFNNIWKWKIFSR